MRFRKIRFLTLGALLAAALPLHAQFGGGPTAAPPPIPGMAQIESAITLTEAQRSKLAPLLQEAAAAQDRLTAAQARLARLQSTLRETLGPVLTDAQKEKLPMALFTARFGRGPRGGPPPAADQPSPRPDANSLAAHQQLLTKRTEGRIDLYFMGDSITRRWGAADYPAASSKKPPAPLSSSPASSPAAPIPSSTPGSGKSTPPPPPPPMAGKSATSISFPVIWTPQDSSTRKPSRLTNSTWPSKATSSGPKPSPPSSLNS